jgi:hypothetical protein
LKSFPLGVSSLADFFRIKNREKDFEIGLSFANKSCPPKICWKAAETVLAFVKRISFVCSTLLCTL